jgi:hypothetical protein
MKDPIETRERLSAGQQAFTMNVADKSVGDARVHSSLFQKPSQARLLLQESLMEPPPRTEDPKNLLTCAIRETEDRNLHTNRPIAWLVRHTNAHRDDRISERSEPDADASESSGSHTVRLTDETQIFLDRSRLRSPNRKGTIGKDRGEVQKQRPKCGSCRVDLDGRRRCAG